MPQVREPDEGDEYVRAAHDAADRLLESLGWPNAQSLVTVSPSYRSLVVAMAALGRLGYDWDPQLLLEYARLMHGAAVLDLDFVETHASEAEKVETAVLGAILVSRCSRPCTGWPRRRSRHGGTASDRSPDGQDRT